jgi:glycosyltransferase involved in cell wall biosynthesis
MGRVRVIVADPSAYTPAYDHALCAALARAGARVELATSHFPYGPVPRPAGYLRRTEFYPGARGPAGSRRRLALKLAGHVPSMLAFRRRAEREADVVHFQWLAAQPLDLHLLPRGVPTVLTAHDVLPREPRPGTRDAQRRLYARVDAVIAHTAHGRDRLVGEAGVPAGKVHVIPHGTLDDLARIGPAPLPPELAAVDGPVALFFGLLRPYKGLDVLLEAWREVSGAELWIAGDARMDVTALRAASPPGVRWLLGYHPPALAAALLRRAQVVVLPYTEIEQSGVLFSALALGRPLLLSDVGGFPEVAAAGAAELVRAGDPADLRAGLERLLRSKVRRASLSVAAERAAREVYGWDAIAERTLELYTELRAAA